MPRRPVATAAVSDGSSAYVAAAQNRTGRECTTPRKDAQADKPARAEEVNNASPTVTDALPSSTVDSAANTARAGAAGSKEPGPTSCQGRR